MRYPLAGVLAVAVCAVLAGARSFAAIGDWALDLGTDQLERHGLAKAPVESTMRKLFARLERAALDRHLAVLAWCRIRNIKGRRVIAIDGKTVRGVRTATTTAPPLIAALDHATGVVLGQPRRSVAEYERGRWVGTFLVALLIAVKRPRFAAAPV